MIPVQGFQFQHVAVLGLGRTGLATAAALRAGGATPICWDDHAEARAAAETAGYQVSDFTKGVGMDEITRLIISPGIPHLYPNPHPAVVAAQNHGIPVDNDIGMFFLSLAQSDWHEFDTPPKVVAVTGSNGKSTTSALIHHILAEADRPVQLAGNIGRGVLDIDPPGDRGVVVLELSSYQTELARALTPDIAVFTNLSPDHLDRHGGLGGYFAAKARLFTQGAPDRAIIGIDEAEGQFLAGQLKQARGDEAVMTVSCQQKLTQPGWHVFARKGFLAEYRKLKQVASIDLRDMAGLPGVHNHQNACAAYASCRALGVAPKVIEQAFASFTGLRHRSQIIAQVADVTYVNDSKATNVDAALMALLAFKNIRWICGGLQKEGGLDALQPGFDNVRKAYVIGRDAAEFSIKLQGVKVETCGNMQAAVAQACKEAEPGDTVLLAPAAASFDQYNSFESRGDDFIAQVKSCLNL